MTDWDIVRATAEKASRKASLEAIMTRQVISAGPDETLLEILRKLELNQISAMPVVDAGRAIGMVSSDLLARRSLLRMLQSQSGE